MTEGPEQVEAYFNYEVQPIFATLMAKLISQRPEDIN